jgi:hypothetical protein
VTITNARPSPFTQLTSQADWELLFQAAGLGDGVNMNGSVGSLAPTLNTGARTLDIAAGSCCIKGALWSTDATVSTAIPAASAQDRIDRLVMRLNRTAGTAAAFLQPFLIQGTPSGSPTIPSLSQTTTGNFDIPIAHWTSRSTGGLVTLVDERQSSSYGTTPVNMPAMTAGWSIGQTAKYRLNGDGDLQVVFRDLLPGTITDGTSIWAAGTFSGQYLVTGPRRMVAYTQLQGLDNSSQRTEGCALEFETDGSINVYGVAIASNRLDFHGTIPLWG